MKVAITGHTAGIGEAIAKKLRQNKIEVIGFSRGCGYDITIPSSVEGMIKASSDCEVFVNNADSDWAQVDLLYKLYEAWKDTSKLIINMSSTSSNGIKSYPHKYAICKKALDEASRQLRNCNGTCDIVTFRPGWVDTVRLKRYENKYGPVKHKFSPDEVAYELYRSITNYNIYITEVEMIPGERPYRTNIMYD